MCLCPFYPSSWVHAEINKQSGHPFLLGANPASGSFSARAPGRKKKQICKNLPAMLVLECKLPEDTDCDFFIFVFPTKM